MKRIGLLGGMSWESSIEYERIINEAVRERLSGVHSADLVTMHEVADAITDAITVPFLHIADATAAAIRRQWIGTVERSWERASPWSGPSTEIV